MSDVDLITQHQQEFDTEFDIILKQIATMRSQAIKYIEVVSTLIFQEQITGLSLASVDLWFQQQQALITLLDEINGMAMWYKNEMVNRIVAAFPDPTNRARHHRRRRYYMQRAINRLAGEVAELAGNIADAQVTLFFNTATTHDAMALLPGFLKSVIATLSLESLFEKGAHIIPMVGDRFFVQFYHYSPTVVVLSIPRATLNSPWNWALFWHELGTFLVTRLDTQAPSTMIQGQQRAKASVLTRSRELKTARDLLREAIDRVAAATSGAPEDLIPDPLIDGSFDIHPTNVEQRQQIRRNWAEELIEDSVALLVIGPADFHSLFDVLEREYLNLSRADDVRHPAPLLRLETALALLQATQPQSPTAIDALTACQARLDRYYASVGHDDQALLAEGFRPFGRPLAAWVLAVLGAAQIPKPEHWWTSTSPLPAVQLVQQAYAEISTFRQGTGPDLVHIRANSFHQLETISKAQDIPTPDALRQQLDAYFVTAQQPVVGMFDPTHLIEMNALDSSSPAPDAAELCQRLADYSFRLVDPWRQVCYWVWY